MDNMLAILSTSNAPEQGFHRSVKLGQQKRSYSRLLNASPAPVSADRNVDTDWTDATNDPVWRFRSGEGESPTHDLALMFAEVPRLFKEAASGSNRTLGASTGEETWGNLPTRLTESSVLFPFEWAEPAPIETLTERSRATINEFTRLEAGWDGYDGIAVLPDIAKHVLCLLDAIGRHTTFRPDVVPLSNGGLQLEWYVGVHEIEVEIAPDCATSLHHERTDDGSIVEAPIDSLHDLAKISCLFRALRR